MNTTAPTTSSVPSIFTNEIFLRAGFGADWGRVKIAFVRGDPERQPRSAWQGFPAEDMLRAEHRDLNTYFSVGVQSGESRSLDGFEAVHVIVLDDIGTKVNQAEAEALLGCSPSYLIETSPGNCQAGWFLEQPLTSREWALGLLKGLYEALGRKADNLRNLVGYMRLPVGVNGKAKLGPAGWRVRVQHWSPATKIKLADWPAIEARIGGVVPIAANLTGMGSMPDPGDIEDDTILRAFELLGRVQGGIRRMTFGWGFDVDCPWASEHSERAGEGASYVPVLQRFHCHHGHCQDRTVADVRVKLDELLREDSGGALSLPAMDFPDDLPPNLPAPVAGAGGLQEKPLEAYARTERGLRQAFVNRYRQRLRMDHARGLWFFWSQGYWKPDSTGHATVLAQELCAEYAAALVDAKPGVISMLGKLSFALAVEKAAGRAELRTDGTEWDRHPWLIGAPGCEVDLITGAVLPPDPTHLISKRVLVAPTPEMPTPLWDQFLWESTADPEVIRYLQAWSGYCLTGDMSEEKFLFLYGPGGNGKGTFLYTINTILHDYAARASADLFMVRRFEAHPEEVARLAGARSVTVSELQEGKTFNVARLKDFTGRDGKMSGRFMRQNTFEFPPQFKLTFVGNHQPRLPEVDDAIRRRLVLVPFMRKPAAIDMTLKDRLVTEYPGILSWMIDGELLRRATPGGLAGLLPAAVTQATEGYLEAQDTLHGWTSERCVFGANEWMNVTEAFNDYRSWCHTRGEMVELSIRDFGRRFTEKFSACKTQHTRAGNVLRGVKLTQQNVSTF